MQATIAWRDWQGDAHRETIDLPISADWTGKQLEVILAPGRALTDVVRAPDGRLWAIGAGGALVYATP